MKLTGTLVATILKIDMSHSPFFQLNTDFTFNDRDYGFLQSSNFSIKYNENFVLFNLLCDINFNLGGIMSFILLIIATALNFGLFYMLMPNISVLVALAFLLIIPGALNGFLYAQQPKKENIILFPVITTIFYVICGDFLQNSGKIEAFAERATVNTGELMVSINTNILGIDMIIFSLLLQVAIVFMVSVLMRKRHAARA